MWRFIFLLFLFELTLTMNAFAETLIIDDRSSASTKSNVGSNWKFFTDQVMGGVSNGELQVYSHQGKQCLRLMGKVSTANNGGFVQMALDLNRGNAFDASMYEGLQIEVAGNAEEYNLHFRTSGLWLPWQAYRVTFKALSQWQTIQIPFSQMKPYRTSQRFQPAKIRRLGFVAIGKDFDADLFVASVSFYGKRETR